MKKLLLIRYESTDAGTFGKLIHTSGTVLETLELPWRGNKKEVSCIPCGSYTLRPYCSERFGNIYAIAEVPNRNLIRIHRGNWAGAIDQGFKSDSTGCILIGMEVGKISEQKAILNSTKALRTLKALTGPFEYQIEIRDL